MSNNSINDLLKPSLADGKLISKSYSMTAHMLVAWFGGPLGASLFSIVNLQQMGVAKKHQWTCIALLAVSLVAILISALVGFGQLQLPSALILGDLKRTCRIAMHLFGVLIFGSFYLAFSRFYIASNQIPSEPPSALKTGAICALIGVMTTLVLVLFIGTKATQ